jgi:hypothetical protein
MNGYKMVMAILNLIVLTLTLGALVAYTVITHRMQKAVAAQVREIVRQRRLSIMPALVARVSGDKFEVTNIGNGLALNIKIARTKIPFPSFHNSYYEFEEVFLLRPSETSAVLYEEYFEGGKQEKGFGDLVHIDEPYAHDKVIVPIRFQDLDGNTYGQTLIMGKGGYKHGFASLIEKSQE